MGGGSGRVGSDFLSAIAGRVGSGQRFAGSGRVGSKDSDRGQLWPVHGHISYSTLFNSQIVHATNPNSYYSSPIIIDPINNNYLKIPAQRFFLNFILIVHWKPKIYNAYQLK